MKKSVSLFLLAPLLLVGCAKTRTMEKEEFMTAYDAMKTSLAEEGAVFDNVRIKLSGGFTHEYNYKAGEYYTYRYTALALIIPINQQNFTWKENGHYYHAEIRTLDKNCFMREIDEASFNSYMASHRQDILNHLHEPLNDFERRIGEEPDPYYENVNTRYVYENRTGFYKAESTANVVSQNTESQEDRFDFWFDQEKPRGFWHRDNPSQYVEYYYGDAKFDYPSDSRLSSQQSSD